MSIKSKANYWYLLHLGALLKLKQKNWAKRMEKYLEKNNPEALPALKRIVSRLARSSNSAMGDTLAECVKGVWLSIMQG